MNAHLLHDEIVISTDDTNEIADLNEFFNQHRPKDKSWRSYTTKVTLVKAEEEKFKIKIQFNDE